MKSNFLADLVANPSKVKEVAAKLFHELDVNKDMKIELHEFQAGFGKIFPECPPADVGNISKDLFEKIDKNKDKYISLEELELHLTTFVKEHK